ncbi:MAG: hypothetical protein PHZ19_11395 [Candidatus Thermoplasmatota archaeon]|nr:hypothetical protein [Candidatus Thermoplasmatota archaeon]
MRPTNELRLTLAAAYTHGVSEYIEVNESLATLLASGELEATGVVRVFDDDEWVLLKYGGVDEENDRLTDLSPAAPRNASAGADEHEFAIGSSVLGAPAADYIRDLSFDSLTDTPASKSGSAGLYARVNQAATALEYVGAADMETSSRTIYVDADSGSDTTGDGSSDAPFATYAKALSTVKNAIADGVTITILLSAASNQYVPATTGRLCIGSGKVVIQGELSAIVDTTCTDGTATTIVKAQAGWEVNAYQHKLVKVSHGGTSDWRIIRSNTADTLTTIGRLSFTPTNGDGFIIYDWGTVFQASDFQLLAGRTQVINCSICGPISIRAQGCWLEMSYCSVVPTSAAGLSAVMTQMADGCRISINISVIKRNSVVNFALRLSDYSYGSIAVARSYIGGTPLSTGTVMTITGPGLFVVVNWGTVVDGGTGTTGSGLVFERGAIGSCYSGVINGDTDKISVINCSATGIRTDTTAGCSYVGTSCVYYDNNGTNYSANATYYSWYTT